MRKLFFAAIITAATVAAIFGTSEASAAYCDMTACSTSTTSDTGTAKTCQNTGPSTCICSVKAFSLGYCGSTITASNPGSCYTNIGSAIGPSGSICYGRKQSCCAAAEVQQFEESVKSTNKQDDLESAFVPRVNEYFGYVGGTLRSPNTGRTQSINARLDICLGSTDVDSAVSNGLSWCMNTACASGSYNEYCQATGINDGVSTAAAVCKDRCQCMINGVGDSSCNQL
jgi:hypothetical protein